MTRPKEPSDAAVLAARIMRSAWLAATTMDDGSPRPNARGGMSPYTAATLAERLCAIERAQRRHAERDCSEEWYHKERLSKSGVSTPKTLTEERIRRQVEQWKADLGMPATIELDDEPGGAVLRLRLPGEAEAAYV